MKKFQTIPTLKLSANLVFIREIPNPCLPAGRCEICVIRDSIRDSICDLIRNPIRVIRDAYLRNQRNPVLICDAIRDAYLRNQRNPVLICDI